MSDSHALKKFLEARIGVQRVQLRIEMSPDELWISFVGSLIQQHMSGEAINRTKRRGALELPLRRQTGLIICEIENELLIYDGEWDRSHCLNWTAAVIWDYESFVNGTILKERQEGPYLKTRRVHLHMTWFDL